MSLPGEDLDPGVRGDAGRPTTEGGAADKAAGQHADAQPDADATAAEGRAAGDSPAGAEGGNEPAGAGGDEARAAQAPADLPPADEPASQEPASEQRHSGQRASDGGPSDDSSSEQTDAAAADRPAGTIPPADAPAPADIPGSAGAVVPADAPSPADALLLSAGELVHALTAVTVLSSRVDDIAEAAAELARLRSRDTDLIARLHDDVTKLRTGEIAAALNPVVIGMIKLHDQMVSLGALNDPASPVGMLHTQLLQVMELTCAVRPFTPSAGERFDAARHTGTRRIPTTEATADGTVASAIRAGFVRADGSVVRVAEVEVHRLSG